jgi:hypothetical protein
MNVLRNAFLQSLTRENLNPTLVDIQRVLFPVEIIVHYADQLVSRYFHQSISWYPPVNPGQTFHSAHEILESVVRVFLLCACFLVRGPGNVD